MKNHLLKNKIPSEDILTENKSRNTKENAVYSSIILKEKFPNGNFLIITSAKHMRRAQYCFNQTNIKTTAFPTDCTTSYNNFGFEYLFLPRADALKIWESLFHEWIGYLVYRLHF